MSTVSDGEASMCNDASGVKDTAYLEVCQEIEPRCHRNHQRIPVVLGHASTISSTSRLDTSFLSASMSRANEGPNTVNIIAMTTISNIERADEGP